MYVGALHLGSLLYGVYAVQQFFSSENLYPVLPHQFSSLFTANLIFLNLPSFTTWIVDHQVIHIEFGFYIMW